MPMDAKDKLKLTIFIVALCIPIWMVTPLGYKSMRGWAVSNPKSGTAKFWMGTATFVCRATLRTELAADYLREAFLLWPNDPGAAAKLVTAGDLYYGLGSTSEKSDQNRQMTRAYDIFEHMRGTGDFDQIKVELEGGEELVYPLKGLTTGQKQEITRKLEYLMETWHNRNMGVSDVWDATLRERNKYLDGWDARRIK